MKIEQSDLNVIVPLIKKVVAEALQEHEAAKVSDKIYTVNQVSKLLKISFTTVKKKIEGGLIRTTTDGKIPEKALKEYLEVNKTQL